jgi:hypothetical protein
VPPGGDGSSKLVAILGVRAGVGYRGISSRHLTIGKRHNAGSFSVRGPEPDRITSVSKHDAPGSVSAGSKSVFPRSDWRTALTHKFLLAELWDSLTDAQYLRVYVRQLRQKIETDPERPQFVLTETGIGYRLRAPDEIAKPVLPLET